jgi:hypothetical protein
VKKRFALVLAAASAMGTIGIVAAHAAPLPTPLGTATVNESGYVVLLDGDAGNPAPLGGYLGVTTDGGVDCGDNAAAQPGSAGFAHGCNPQPPA